MVIFNALFMVSETTGQLACTEPACPRTFCPPMVPGWLGIIYPGFTRVYYMKIGGIYERLMVFVS